MPPRTGLPRLKGGPVRAGAGQRFVVRRAEALSESAIALLLGHAELLSEGALRGNAYFGSTMLTVELAALGESWRAIAEDARERARLLRALEGSVRFRVRLLRTARAEMLRRLPGLGAGTMVAETRFRMVEGRLHADVDVEAPVDVSSARRRREG